MEKDLDLPEPGSGRWWKIELITGQTGKPIKVTLMESFDAEAMRPKPARALYYLRTVANAESVKEAAEQVLATVGDYAKFVGEYTPSRDPREGGEES